MLRQYYSFAGEGDDARDVLREAMRSMMYAVIRPSGELLTRLPAGEGIPNKTAGPGFELYGDFTGLVTPKIGWTIVLERLAAECKEADRLAGQLSADRQDELRNVGQSLNEVRGDLQARLGAGI